MLLWIFIIIFLISMGCYHFGKRDQFGKTRYGKLGEFCDKLFSTIMASITISSIVLVLLLLGLVITHVDFHSFVAERNAVQLTLNEYRKNEDISILEKVGAIQQAFEINKEIGVAKYWHSNFWTGAFWPDSVEDLDYIK